MSRLSSRDEDQETGADHTWVTSFLSQRTSTFPVRVSVTRITHSVGLCVFISVNTTVIVVGVFHRSSNFHLRFTILHRVYLAHGD